MSDIRPGETATSVPPSHDAAVTFIGRLHTPWNDRRDCPRQGGKDGPICKIEVFDPWVTALTGIDDYDALDLLYWLDKSRRDLLTQSPRSDGRTTGTFALRSPVRPNPIGLANVKLISRDGRFLSVRGLDCLDGTPLIDIKPDRCSYTPPAPPKPGVTG